MAMVVRGHGPLRPKISSSSSFNRISKSLIQTRSFQQSIRSVIPQFAFAFDIDGVLLRSSEPIPRAKQALTALQSRRIPFILLTNGGGKSERERVSELSKRLGVSLDTSMFVQSHTPFASLVHGSKDSAPMKDEPILVVGGEGDQCRRVAEAYGFTRVIIPSDIYNAHPSIWPFSSPFASYHRSAARPLPLPVYSPSCSEPPTTGKHLRISSIFVYNDPRDFGLDAQLVLDLLLSHNGFLGTRSGLSGREDLPNAGYQHDGQPPLVFANPDLFWAAKWHIPRLGSGGFKAALEGLWNAITGGRAKLEVTMGGKPSTQTFSFAEERLVAHRKWLLSEDGLDKGPTGDLKRVYMVGDNPASDILGANRYKSPRASEWSSILVRSGVFAGEQPLNDEHRPKALVNDVLDAVNWAFQREGIERT